MIPINIAVTGHRDLSLCDVDLYKNTVSNIIKEYQNRYPNSKIQILSGMAEGADIITARAALELGCGLIAVLPMKKEDFIETFADKDNSAPVFEDTLLKADSIIDLSEVYKSYAKDSDAYVRLGVYLTQHAQSILALWDGKNNNSPGGTASVVQTALESIPRKYRENHCVTDRYDTVPVHHIKVRRIKDTEGTLAEYTSIQNDGYKTLYPQIWDGSDKHTMVSYYEDQLEEIDSFNKHAKNHDCSKGYLNGSDDITLNSNAGIEKIIIAQKTADTLAVKYQNKTVKFLILQLLFGFFVFFWVSLVDEIVPFAPYILFLSPVFFILCVLMFRHINKRSIEERYYSYRALAECLRIQFYWKSAGIKADSYSSYSKKNAFELGWIVQACKNISMDVNLNLSAPMDKPESIAKIKEYWLKDQCKYFSSKTKENINVINKNKKRTFLLFGAGLLFVILLIVERLVLSLYFDSELLMHLLLFLIDASLAGGAIFSGYIDKRQFESEQKQYSRMAMILNQGLQELDCVISEKEIQDIIVELGCDALAENADWVIYNRMSNIEIPLG